MFDIFRSIAELPAPFSMVAFIVLFGATATTISHVATEVRKFCSHREELELKRELAERGMPAREIELVMRASAERSTVG